MDENVERRDRAHGELDGAAGRASGASALGAPATNGKSAAPADDITTMTPEAIRCELRSLREQQAELVRQHEELQRSRSRYLDLYDLAPVGFCTVNESGLIIQANVTATTLLGLAPGELDHEFLAHFVLKDDMDRCTLLHRRVSEAREPQSCEVRMVKHDGTLFWAELVASVATGAGSDGVHYVSLSDITALKRAETSSRASEQRFRDMIDSTDGIVWEADATTFNFTFISDKAERLLGYATEDWLKPGFWVENLHPDDKSWAPEFCASCTGRLEPHNFEYRFIARDGRTVWLHDIVTVVSEDGLPRWLRGVMVDITERKLAEAALRESEAQNRALISAIPDLIFTNRRDGEFIAVQASDPKALFVPAEAFLGKRVDEVLPEPVAARFVATFGESLDSNSMKELHYSLPMPSGEAHFEARVVPCTEDSVVTIVRDITERKKAEDALRESEARFRAVVDAVPAAIRIYDGDNVVFTNSFIQRLSGYSSDEVARPGFLQSIVVPEDLASALARSERRLRGEPIDPHYEFRIARKDGAIRWTSNEAVSITFDGRPATLTAAVDITDRKASEEALRRSDQQLRMVVAHAPVLFWAVDSDGIYTHYEGRTAEIGRSMVGRSIFNQTRDYPEIGERVRRGLAGEEFTAEQEIGDRTWEARHVPIHDGSGRITGLAGVTIDVTERKRHEEALKRAGEQLRLVVANAPVTFWATDADGTFTHYEGRETQPGRSMVGRTMFDSAKGNPKILDNARRALAGEEFIAEEQIGDRTFEARHVPVRDDTGRITGLVGVTTDITERKQAEDALRASEVRYQRITGAVTDYIYTVHVQGGRAVQTIHGPGCIGVTGYGAEEFAANPRLWLQMVIEKDRPEVEHQARLTLAGDDPPPIEHRITHKNGSERWVRSTTVPRRNELGHLVSYDGLIQDITERKRAETALRQSETKWRSLFEILPVGVSVLDSRRGITEMNPALEQILDLPRARMLAGTHAKRQYFHPDLTPMAPTDFPSVRAALEGAAVGPVEIGVVKEDGATVWTEVTATPVPFDDASVVVVTVDTTERRKADEALRTSEALYRSILDSSPDTVAITGMDARLRVYSAASVAMFALDPGTDLTGRLITDFIAPDDRARAVENISRMHVRGEDRSERAPDEYRALRGDGTTFFVEVMAEFIADGDGQPTGIVFDVRDVSERKRAEETLRKARELLDQSQSMAKLGGWEYDLAADRVSWTNEVYRIYGVGPDFDPGDAEKNIGFFAPGDALTINNAFRGAVERGEPYDLELRLVQMSGQTIWVRTFGRAISEQGRVVRVAGGIQDITERRLAEDALRESEERYRDLVETSHDLIWRCDAEGRFTFLNRAWETTVGYSREEMLGRPFADFERPAMATRDMAEFERHLAGGSIIGHETVYITKSGDEAVLLFNAIPTRDGQGNIIGTQGTATDITARKRAEVELRTLSRAVEQSPASIVITNRAGNIEYVNPRFEEVTGYTRVEALGNNPRIIKSGKTPLGTYTELWQAIGEGGEWHGELLNRRKNGELFWERAAISGLTDEYGEVTHYLAVKEDITESKRAEDAIRESEARFRAVVDTVPAAIRIYDGSRVVFANEASSIMSGYPREEILEPGWLDLVVAPEDRSALAERERRRLNGERVASQSTNRIVRKDGQVRWVQSDYVPITFGGRPALLAASIDITERRQAEEERRKLELHIQDAQKLESLGALAGGIAHDFNNVLAAVLGNAGLALMELPADSPTRETVHAIESAAQRAAELTRQMLAYAGKGRFVIEPTNLSRLVEETGNLLEVAASKRVSLEYQLAADLPLVEADASQLRQVLINLVTNASDAIGEADGVITIGTGTQMADRAYLAGTYLDGGIPEGEYAYVEVTDTGSGMDDETITRIFDPFFSTKFTGRGLGLAAVLGIVRGHHGAIRVSSTPGSGTTFRVLFPVLDAAMATTDGAVRGRPAEATGVPAATRYRVLVVDDDDIVRSVTRRILEHSGYAVGTAHDGPEALAALELDELPDLVLLDMTMPGMDGDATFRELQRINPHIPVVLMSGYSEADATEQFTGKGLAGFIQKPFHTAELLTLIRDALAGRPTTSF